MNDQDRINLAGLDSSIHEAEKWYTRQHEAIQYFDDKKTGIGAGTLILVQQNRIIIEQNREIISTLKELKEGIVK